MDNEAEEKLKDIEKQDRKRKECNKFSGLGNIDFSSKGEIDISLTNGKNVGDEDAEFDFSGCGGLDLGGKEIRKSIKKKY